MIDIFDSIRTFNECQMLQRIDSKPKLLTTEAFYLNYKLIKEENREYLKACRDGDLKEIADALGDLFFVIIGMVCKHGMQGIFFDQIIKPICESNATKFCNTREEAKMSVQKYKEKDVETTYVEWDGKFVIIDLHSGKILKGINYQEPNIQV